MRLTGYANSNSIKDHDGQPRNSLPNGDGPVKLTSIENVHLERVANSFKGNHNKNNHSNNNNNNNSNHHHQQHHVMIDRLTPNCDSQMSIRKKDYDPADRNHLDHNQFHDNQRQQGEQQQQQHQGSSLTNGGLGTSHMDLARSNLLPELSSSGMDQQRDRRQCYNNNNNNNNRHMLNVSSERVSSSTPGGGGFGANFATPSKFMVTQQSGSSYATTTEPELVGLSCGSSTTSGDVQQFNTTTSTLISNSTTTNATLAPSVSVSVAGSSQTNLTQQQQPPVMQQARVMSQLMVESGRGDGSTNVNQITNTTTTTANTMLSVHPSSPAAMQRHDTPSPAISCTSTSCNTCDHHTSDHERSHLMEAGVSTRSCNTPDPPRMFGSSNYSGAGGASCGCVGTCGHQSPKMMQSKVASSQDLTSYNTMNNSINNNNNDLLERNNNHHHHLTGGRKSLAGVGGVASAIDLSGHDNGVLGINKLAEKRCSETTLAIGARGRSVGSTTIAPFQMVKLQATQRQLSQNETTTRLLIAVMIVFLICEFPAGILAGLCAILGEGFFENVYQPTGSLTDLLALINSSVNFILYCFMSTQFRVTFYRVVLHCPAPNAPQ